MAELCTERSHTSQLLVLFTPNMPRHWFSQHTHSGILCVGYPIFIPYLSLILPGSYHVYSILIPCLSYACRTLCSVCPSILLYWKTPQTSLLKTAQTQPRTPGPGLPGVGQEGKQRPRGKPVAAGVWAWQASSGGSVRVSD